MASCMAASSRGCISIRMMVQPMVQPVTMVQTMCVVQTDAAS